MWPSLRRFLLAFLIVIVMVAITTGIIMTLQKTNTNIPYLTPEIVDAQKWATVFNALTQALVGATFLVGITAMIFNNRVDELKTIRMSNTWELQQQASLQIASLDKETESLKLNIEGERVKRQEAELKAKQVELELERLRISVRDRVLPSDKIPAISDKLRALQGSKLSLASLSSDIEAVNFMNQVASLFKSNGWIVETHTPILFGLPQPPGLRIFINDEQFASRAETIKSCLAELGFKSEMFLDKSSKSECEIIVGAKERKPQ